MFAIFLSLATEVEWLWQRSELSKFLMYWDCKWEGVLYLERDEKIDGHFYILIICLLYKWEGELHTIKEMGKLMVTSIFIYAWEFTLHPLNQLPFPQVNYGKTGKREVEQISHGTGLVIKWCWQVLLYGLIRLHWLCLEIGKRFLPLENINHPLSGLVVVGS